MKHSPAHWYDCVSKCEYRDGSGLTWGCSPLRGVQEGAPQRSHSGKTDTDQHSELPLRSLTTNSDCRYLQLPGSHLENELHHRADGEASRAGGVDLVPNGVAVHLETQNVSHQSSTAEDV